MKAGHPRAAVSARPGIFLITTALQIVLLVSVVNGASAQRYPEEPDAGLATAGNPASAKPDAETYSAPTSTQEERKTVPAPAPEMRDATPEHDGPYINPCDNIAVSGDTWLDQTHDYVERHICRPAVWFDHFFGDHRLLQDVRPGTFAKLRNAARLTEGENIKPLFEYRFHWQLPQWNKYLRKARIFVESGSETVKYTTQPGQAIEPGVDPATGVRKKPIIGVRAEVYTRQHSKVNFESGGNLNMHPDAFTRMRYEFSKSFDEVYLIRFSQIAMWQVIEHFTDTTQLDLERTITTFTLVRWANNATYTQGSNGITWNTGVSYLTQLTPKSAISCDSSMWGVNYPGWSIENYRLGSKYRRNFHRPWLFFELDPEVTLPIDANGKRNTVYAFMATFEIQFGQ